MFPTVGLYLPNTLHRTMDSVTDRPATASSKRHPAERTSFDRPRTGRNSMSTEEISNCYPSVSTALRFADFVTSLNDASAEIRTLVTVLQRVGKDISLALRLRNSSHVKECCQSRPDERIWIDSVLVDVQSAINDIGAFVENVRVSGDEGGEVKLKQKFNWILSHHHKVRDRQATLLICHQSLSTAINFMQMIKMGELPHSHDDEAKNTMSMIHEAPVRPWIQEDDSNLLRGPYMRHRHRLSQRNLSVPSISVSQFEDKKKEGLTHICNVNATAIDNRAILTGEFEPVELPGSTPEDLPDPDNWDLYSLPPKPQSNKRDATPPPPPIVTSRVDDTSESYTSPKTPIHANSVPILAKRYRARRVLVPAASPGRHRSLPIQLPYIPQTPSLVSDLSGWMSECESDVTPTIVDSPVSSNASSPTAPRSVTSGADRVLSFDSSTSATSINATSRPEGNTSDIDIPQKQMQNSPDLPQESPLDLSAGRSSIESRISVETPGESTSPSVASVNPDIDTETQAGVATQPSPLMLPIQEEAPPEQPPPAPMDLKIPTQTETQTLTMKPKPNSTIVAPPAVPKASIGAGHVESGSNPNQAKPMTSQAKRRAAHVRRMRATYG